MRREDDIAAGDLTQVIALYSPQHNASGDEITGYTLIASGIPAKKEIRQGRESQESGRIASEQPVVWMIRYRTGLDEVAQLTHAGSVYEVLAVEDPTGNRRKIEITTRAVR